MIEIKGRVFEGELADLIRNNEDIADMFEKMFTYDVDEATWS